MNLGKVAYALHFLQREDRATQGVLKCNDPRWRVVDVFFENRRPFDCIGASLGHGQLRGCLGRTVFKREVDGLGGNDRLDHCLTE